MMNEVVRIKEEDEADIALAHGYRLSLMIAPRQSSFRVVAVVFYELLLGNKEQDEHKRQQRHHVVGTNDEPCYINGSICAERAALIQLRFLPIKRITKVVITTDAVHPIFPGMLCREFMASHMYIDPETMPVVTSGSLCRKAECRYDVSGKDARTNDNDKQSIENGCIGNTFHDWEVVRTTLVDLYPYPSPYTRLTAGESINLGKRESPVSHIENFSIALSHNLDAISKEAELLILEATKAAQENNDRSELHPIQYAAAVLFEDGNIETACQRKTLEYGCSVDAVTQLAFIIERNNKAVIKADTDEELETNGGTSTRTSKLNNVRPKLLVQCDQFGIIHAPFATARAYLSEFHYGNCEVLVQKFIEDPPSPSCLDTDDLNEVQILSIPARILAPSAPHMGDLWTD